MSFSDVQTRLLKARLNPDHVRSRVADGQILSYLEGWHVIAEANRIFGFGGWDRETVSLACVFTRQTGEQYCAAYTAKVRITVRAGEHTVVREGSGAGEACVGSPGQAHEVASKAAETDATKRALMTFGNPFGLSLYRGVVEPARSRRDYVDGKAADPKTTTLPASRDVPKARQPVPSSRPHTSARDDAGAASGAGITSTAGSGTDHPANALASPDATQGITKPTAAAPPSVPHRVDKSALALPEPRRLRDPDHLRRVAAEPCLICGRKPAQAHHLKFAQPTALSRKVSDEFTVPLCAIHHRELHQTGDELPWWEKRKIDPLPIAQSLWFRSRSRQTQPASPESPLNGTSHGW